MSETKYTCSFCDIPESEARFMVASNEKDVAICDVCILTSSNELNNQLFTVIDTLCEQVERLSGLIGDDE